MLSPRLSKEETVMRRMHSTLAFFTVSLLACVLLALGIYARTAHAQSGAQSKLVVPITTSNGTSAGTATFKESKDGKQLTIDVRLKNLPFGEHAVHIHANPVCDAPDFKGAGGHFNPDGKQHGTENPMGHHNGDLPKNISIDEDHTGELTVKVGYLTLAPGAPNSVLGHSIVVHEKADDMKTDPTGNAGNRIACGVIPAAAM
jgi:Cu-Zn family superoxide dismutase